MKSLRKRQEFLTLRDKGVKQVDRYFILQAFRRSDDGGARYGLTASKKTGNAVRRNKARRRMRALMRLYLCDMARADFDYGLIARYDLAESAWDELVQHFTKVVTALHAKADKIEPSK